MPLFISLSKQSQGSRCILCNISKHFISLRDSCIVYCTWTHKTYSSIMYESDHKLAQTTLTLFILIDKVYNIHSHVRNSTFKYYTSLSNSLIGVSLSFWELDEQINTTLMSVCDVHNCSQGVHGQHSAVYIGNAGKRWTENKETTTTKVSYTCKTN